MFPRPRLLLSALVVVLSPLAGLGSACAAEIQRPDIAGMAAGELESFVGTVTASVAHDAIGLEPMAKRGDCLELLGAANATALAYDYLAQARNRALAIGRDAQVALARTIQARVMTFATRLRAEDWLKTCGTVKVPSQSRGDPRYAPLVPIDNSEFGDAVVEARDGTQLNLIAAAAAARAGQCPLVIQVAKSITLYVPYLDRLAAQLAARPLALGPRASRRAVLNDRTALVAAERDLWRKFGPQCLPTTKAPAGGTPSGEDATPGGG